jgi:hypothetical protein
MQFLLKAKRDFNVAPRETKEEKRNIQAYFKTTSEVLEYLFSLLQIVLAKAKSAAANLKAGEVYC